MSVKINSIADLKKDDLAFFALGGLGDIGRNFYGYHVDGKILFVDLGTGFADPLVMPGIEQIIPKVDESLIRSENIIGVVITHAHEDHIGAIPHVWEVLRCPIYASPFTSQFIRLKLQEYGLVSKVDLIEFDISAVLDLAPFSLEFVALTHSIPENLGILIKTAQGNIFHTGDWKFDDDPVIGTPSDYEKLKRFGSEGILAMVCDSTNSLVPKRGNTEGSLFDEFVELFKKSRRLTLISLFASNIARIITIARAAKACGKQVMILGKSLLRSTEVAKRFGYWDSSIELLSEGTVSFSNRGNLVTICTGCQGEQMAVMYRILFNSNPPLKLEKGDTVIFSSKIIPGNEKKLTPIFNEIIDSECELITEMTHDVHVSGHPSQEEMTQLYKMINPRFAVTMHGDNLHRKEHEQVALKAGVKAAVSPKNGDIIVLNATTPYLFGCIDTGYLGIDGNYIRAPQSAVMITRRRMMAGGAVIVVLTADSNWRLARPPVILMPGLCEQKGNKVIFDRLTNRIAKVLQNSPIRDRQVLNDVVMGEVKSFCKAEFGKAPFITFHVERLHGTVSHPFTVPKVAIDRAPHSRSPRPMLEDLPED